MSLFVCLGLSFSAIMGDFLGVFVMGLPVGFEPEPSNADNTIWCIELKNSILHSHLLNVKSPIPL